jgi:hypothetical protein
VLGHCKAFYSADDSGRDDKLFRAGIAESGGPSNIFFPLLGGYNSTQPQEAYDNLVSNTSCATTINTQASLSCLRALPFSELNAALNISINGLPNFAPVIDNDFIADYPSKQQVNSGKLPSEEAVLMCHDLGWLLATLSKFPF